MGLSFTMSDDFGTILRENLGHLIKRGDQRKIAELADCEPSYISEVLNKKHNKRFNEDLLNAFLKFYKIKPWQLFHDQKQIKQEVLSDDELMFMRDYLKLNGVNRNKIHGMIDAYLKEQES